MNDDLVTFERDGPDGYDLVFTPEPNTSGAFTLNYLVRDNGPESKGTILLIVNEVQDAS